MKIHLKISFLMLLLYIVQFVLLPGIAPKYYPRSNEAFAMFIVSQIVIFIVGMCFISSNMQHWLLADFLYIILILMYSGHGAYGLGMSGISIDGLQATYSHLTIYDLILVILLTGGIQLIVKGIICIVGCIIKSSKF